MVHASGGKSSIPQKFKDYVEAVFPFTEKESSDSDDKLKEVMRKEAEKGPIQFAAQHLNPFKAAAKRLSLPDDFKKKLYDKAKR